MHDPALSVLLQQLTQSSGPAIWIADENNAEAMQNLAVHRQRLVLLTNRYDIFRGAKACGIPAWFSDFDLAELVSSMAARQPQQVFYRVSKERPVVHHLLNSASLHLEHGSTLWLSGQKSEGIKGYFKRAAELFGTAGTLQKAGAVYCGELRKTEHRGALLDDQRYSELRWVEPKNGEGFFSKPGTYGWDKIDQGSLFLMDHARALLDEKQEKAPRLLDLGCGYGFLTIAARHWQCASVTATDNNAAAIRCMRANAERYNLPATVVADDCGSELSGPYDLILCNPPFHQGFSVAGDLTDKFIATAARLLAPGGRAAFVVNAFIPLERKARASLSNRQFDVELLANNGQFKVVILTRT